ncbi:MAG: ParA family protein [Anaerolineales bacterium]|nr:ParA family protein [Anaerolineales bacterium]MCS7247170.1 ParA family protein [Anaerolineales bacterium]MDW8160981.1 ParA family protein [Anaerolineales bacterium]MDW8446150.1 ParA family protein [Anaerolineales bacterium]
MSYILAIANQKGGVAKTTTAAGLSGALVQEGYEVLAIDLDPQANLTIALGLNPREVRHSAADLFIHTEKLASLTQATSIPGLDIVPANREMELSERFIPLRKNHELILRQQLLASEITSAYDFVVLDCPAFLGAITTNAMVAANLLIIPTQPEYFSLHALRNTLTQVRTVRQTFNPSLAYRILITLRDLRNRVHRTMSEHLLNTFPDGVLKTSIDLDTKLRESAATGMPVNFCYPKSRGAEQYRALATEILEYVREKNSIPA